MDSLRLWILGVAAGSFATGLIVGGALPGAGAAVASHEDGYADELGARYGLSEPQVRQLRMVLRKQREVEFAIWLGVQQSQLPPELQRELLATRKKTNDRVRMVLDDEQRARYDDDCRPPGGTPGEGEKR